LPGIIPRLGNAIGGICAVDENIIDRNVSHRSKKDKNEIKRSFLYRLDEISLKKETRLDC
jgi:hypothetical protein